MFLEFKKVTSANVAQLSPLIVRAEDLLSIDWFNYENANLQINNATHIEIGGNPKYSFYTLSTLASIEAALNVIDITSGFIPGPPCSGGNAIVIVAPESALPLLRIPTVLNYTVTQSVDFIINPNKILYVENTIFNDTVTQSQQQVVMIILNDTNRTKLLTTIPYAEIFSILQPVQVSSP